MDASSGSFSLHSSSSSSHLRLVPPKIFALLESSSDSSDSDQSSPEQKIDSQPFFSSERRTLASDHMVGSFQFRRSFSSDRSRPSSMEEKSDFPGRKELHQQQVTSYLNEIARMRGAGSTMEEVVTSHHGVDSPSYNPSSIKSYEPIYSHLKKADPKFEIIGELSRTSLSKDQLRFYRLQYTWLEDQIEKITFRVKIEGKERLEEFLYWRTRDEDLSQKKNDGCLHLTS